MNRLITSVALGAAILNMRGTNLPINMRMNNLPPPPQEQAAYGRYEMTDGMKTNY
jgi:hypothetical protein